SPATSLDNLKQEAKRWHRALAGGDAVAWARFRAALGDAPIPERPARRDVQHALAREHGLPGWAAPQPRREDRARRHYGAVAKALVTAYATPDPAAMRTVWNYSGHMRAWEGMRRYVRLDLGGPEDVADPGQDFITLAQARYLVARAQGFAGWGALAEYTAALPAGRAF